MIVEKGAWWGKKWKILQNSLSPLKTRTSEKYIYSGDDRILEIPPKTRLKVIPHLLLKYPALEVYLIQVVYTKYLGVNWLHHVTVLSTGVFDPEI